MLGVSFSGTMSLRENPLVKELVMCAASDVAPVHDLEALALMVRIRSLA
jgi:hypothetical protein